MAVGPPLPRAASTKTPRLVCAKWRACVCTRIGAPGCGARELARLGVVRANGHACMWCAWIGVPEGVMCVRLRLCKTMEK